MKTINLLLIIIAVAFIFSNCDKDEDNPIINNASMSAQVDGSEWSAITRVTVLKNNKFIITGTSVSGTVINVTILGITTGTYTLTLDSLTAQFSGLYQPSATSPTEDNYIVKSGKVVISEINTSDKKISGTFEFAAKNILSGEEKSITNGVFNYLKYSVED